MSQKNELANAYSKIEEQLRDLKELRERLTIVNTTNAALLQRWALDIENVDERIAIARAMLEGTGWVPYPKRALERLGVQLDG